MISFFSDLELKPFAMKLLLKSLLVLVCFQSCIKDDIINDRVPERLTFDNPISEIMVNDTYQLEVTFFNNIGSPENANVQWSSSEPQVATVSQTGLLNALTEGQTEITVTVTLAAGGTVSDSFELVVTADPVDNGLVVKSGSIITTSSYTLEGDFTISEIQDSNDLIIEFSSNYSASSNLPGLYLYLTNNPNSISGGFEIGAVTTFNGTHSYLVEDKGINDYIYLLYWCEPFSVKVGHGEIND